MTIRPIALLLSSAFLMFAAAPTVQAGTIQGTPVILEHEPAGIQLIGEMQTDAITVFRNLKPGKYVAVIKGADLVATMDRIHPPAKKSGGGLSLGIGGMFGGGSSHSSSGHEGVGSDGHPTHGSSHTSSSGGVGVGVSIPVGSGDKDSGAGAPPAISVTITLPGSPGILAGHSQDDHFGLMTVSSQTPYCRDAFAAGGDIRIGFTVPEGVGGIGVEIVVLSGPRPTDEDHTAY